AVRDGERDEAGLAARLDQARIAPGGAKLRPAIAADRDGAAHVHLTRVVAHVQNERVGRDLGDLAFVDPAADDPADRPGRAVVVAVNDVRLRVLRPRDEVIAGNHQAPAGKLDADAGTGGVTGPVVRFHLP